MVDALCVMTMIRLLVLIKCNHSHYRLIDYSCRILWDVSRDSQAVGLASTGLLEDRSKGGYLGGRQAIHISNILNLEALIQRLGGGTVRLTIV